MAIAPAASWPVFLLAGSAGACPGWSEPSCPRSITRLGAVGQREGEAAGGGPHLACSRGLVARSDARFWGVNG